LKARQHRRLNTTDTDNNDNDEHRMLFTPTPIIQKACFSAHLPVFFFNKNASFVFLY